MLCSLEISETKVKEFCVASNLSDITNAVRSPLEKSGGLLI
jgi:hypothetical protein